MDLFDFMRETGSRKESPLASRLRPSTLSGIVGQQHILGKDRMLYRAIQADSLRSLLFYGPPGLGKTTLANVIVSELNLKYRTLNAVINSKKDIDVVIEEAKISYAPGHFPKMKDEKIINVACNYAHISRRTYIPYTGDYIYD